jgi:hypothetical protein
MRTLEATLLPFKIAAAALKVRLEIAAKSKMDLGEVAAVVPVAADGTAVPAADGTAAPAPAADAKDASADKDKK